MYKNYCNLRSVVCVNDLYKKKVVNLSTNDQMFTATSGKPMLCMESTPPPPLQN